MDGSRLLVTESSWTPHLWVFDAATLAPIESVALPKVGAYIAFDGATGLAYISTVFDLATRSMLSEVLLPESAAYTNVNGFAATNPITHRVYLSSSNVLVLQDTVTLAAATPGNSQVEPVTVETTAVSLTFSDVATSGETTVTPIDPSATPLPAPGQYAIDGAPACEITTTASFSGPITLCFQSAVDDPDVFGALRVLHGENGVWVDRTVSHDYASGQICAEVTSLSPFVIASLHASFGIASLIEGKKPFKSGTTAPIKLRVLGSGGVNVSSPLVAVHAKRLTRPPSGVRAAMDDAGKSNPDGAFRYDASFGGYVFTLSIKGLAAGVYELTVQVAGDSAPKMLRFEVR